MWDVQKRQSCRQHCHRYSVEFGSSMVLLQTFTGV